MTSLVRRGSLFFILILFFSPFTGFSNDDVKWTISPPCDLENLSPPKVKLIGPRVLSGWHQTLVEGNERFKAQSKRDLINLVSFDDGTAVNEIMRLVKIWNVDVVVVFQHGNDEIVRNYAELFQKLTRLTDVRLLADGLETQGFPALADQVARGKGEPQMIPFQTKTLDPNLEDAVPLLEQILSAYTGQH